jgi:uncharacterized protein (DUF58 family)
VLPRLLPEFAVIPYTPQAMGHLGNSRKGLGSDIYGIRNYHIGDPARYIHWKQSARGQGIKMKEFEEETNQKFRIMLDVRCPPSLYGQRNNALETAISLTAPLAGMLIRRDFHVGLWTTRGNIPVNGGPSPLFRIMRSLASIEPMDEEENSKVSFTVQDDIRNIWIDYLDANDKSRSGLELRRPPSHALVIDIRNLKLTTDPVPRHEMNA